MMKLSYKDLIFVPITLLVFALGITLNYFAVGVIITLGFGVYTLFKPKNGLIILFMYLPLRPFLLEFNPDLKSIADIILFIALVKVVYMYRKNWKSLFQFQWFELAYFGFILVGVISALITGVSLTSIILQTRSFILLYVMFYIIKRINVTKQDLIKLGWTIVVLTIIISIHGLIEKLSLRSVLLPESWENMPLSATNRIRIYGLLGNPNSLALYMSFVFIIIMYLKNHVQKNKYLILNITLILAMGVFSLTFSRGTWGAFAITALLYIILTKNWRFLKNLAISLVLGILLIALPVSGITTLVENTDFGVGQREVQKEYDQTDGNFSDRMRQTFDQSTIEGSMDSGRLFIIQKGFQVFKDHPIIGTGFGTFGDSSTLSQGSPIYETYDIGLDFYSDNQYIQIIVQTGIIGTILFAIFLLHMLYLTWKHGRGSNYGILVFCLLLGSYVICMVYNAWESDIFTLFYFSFLGYLVNEKFREKVNQHAIE
ncbi:hypothetical protein CIL05_01205 [Virgibacillus profundi]|uniref:O-antigen ligase-related domain-containing protein n=1 Tax=Virgibacillus profundi TaxID=2024555 RepID=A0A2A2IIT6_9BACI|nr:O-antigen ligase family protein [Virgibacillus profundi]PAV31298.1 hypothetical protein CIL05_01205 [Virgibacillus profundi]PXY55483.1 O-antigen ligase family protein [Virgibacillus profundi]